MHVCALVCVCARVCVSKRIRLTDFGLDFGHAWICRQPGSFLFLLLSILVRYIHDRGHTKDKSLCIYT